MAFSCVVDPGRSLGTIKLTESVTEIQLIEALKALYGGDTWQPGYSTFWDCIDIKELVITRKGLDAIVEATATLQPRMGPGKSAFAVRRKLDESMAKIILHMTKSTDRERRLFRSREDAMEWLNQ